jgi:uncharacterized membrane protein YccC
MPDSNAIAASSPAKPVSVIAEALRDWRALEWPKWIFVLRTFLAVCAALWIAFRLGFTSPSTAMTTVFIVSLPQAGQVLAKSFYRTIGTLAGAAIAILLVGNIVQDRTLFIVLLAAWLGICTTGAAYFRGFQAYAFVLSGYTASIIALPALAQPQAVFDIALFRVSEVMLGIFCAGVFADLLLPNRVTDQLIKAVREGYASFIDYLQQARDGRLELAAFEESNLAFITRAIEFEGLRESGYFENPEIRVRSARLRLYNAEFMNVGTAFYGFYAMLGRRRRAGDEAIVAAFRALSDPLLMALQPGGRPPANAAEARRVLSDLREFRSQLPRRLRATHVEVDTATRAAGKAFPEIRFDTVARQFDRFLEALTRVTEAYAALDQLGAKLPHRVAPFSPHTETLGAVMMGLRAFLTVLLVAGFWIVSAWPAGASATIIAGVICALFAAAPKPAVAARNLLYGFIIAMPAAGFLLFAVLPHLEGFALLCAAFAPFAMASVYAMATPSIAGIGLGFNLLFANLVGINNVMDYDPIGFFNNGIAQILGVIAGLLMLTAIMPAAPREFALRMRAQLRRNAELACRAPLIGLRARFESRTRDSLVQLVSRADHSRGEHLPQLAHALAVLDLGDAIIHLRRAARDAGARFPAPMLNALLHNILALLHRPSPIKRAAALAAVEAAIALQPDIYQLPSVVIDDVASDRPIHAIDDPLWRMATDLMRIRGILNDEPWFAEMVRTLDMDRAQIAEEPAPEHTSDAA